MAGATTVDEAFEVLAGGASSSGGGEADWAADWEELFSTRWHGRPYYHNKATGRTSWDEPQSFRSHNEAVDAAAFGLSVAQVRSVMGPLRRLQAGQEAWPPARELLAKVLGAIAASPAAPKVRSLRKGNESFGQRLWRQPGGAELLQAVGFRPEADCVTLSVDCPLEPLRLALAHVTRSQRLTDDVGAGSSAGRGQPRGPQEAGAYRWQAEVHYCGGCDALIHDGSERVWTGAHDAPLGQYRYACEQCEGFSLCELCMEARNAGKGGKGVAHAASHTFEVVPPVTSVRPAAFYRVPAGLVATPGAEAAPIAAPAAALRQPQARQRALGDLRSRRVCAVKATADGANGSLARDDDTGGRTGTWGDCRSAYGTNYARRQ